MHDLLVDKDLSLAYRKISSIPVQLAWDPLGIFIYLIIKKIFFLNSIIYH